MPLLSLNRVSLAYGHHPLLSEVEFQIEAGERVCLIGRNGTGKSTLFRIISGMAQPDDGEVWHKDTLRISHLEQDVPVDTEKTIFELVSEGLGKTGKILVDYHNASLVAQDDDPASLARLSELQHQIEVADGWNLNQKVETVLSKLVLPADRKLEACSGGVRRRVMLARALVSEPDLLLLDEPTNHMDIAAINWLEEYLLGFPGALIFITHDRTFLKHVATRIVELDRGRLTSFNGDFDFYLKRKEEMADAEMKEYEKFDKKLAEHEAWIRKGIKARRTRNQGRVRTLEAMRAAKAERMSAQGNVTLTMNTGDSSGKLVADVQHVSFSYNSHEILHDFSTRILRGDRVGILGPNGAGKSTLLKILLGELKPQHGQVVLGTRLEIAYFDQQRDQLELDKSVKHNISQGHDYINVRGRSRHVISYLKDFLFPPDRIDTPVRVLSGGERNRLLLARIFTQASNMLVLDEPTNDLDVDTLELLEELLSDYEGTIILVSHDRTFLDNLVTSTIVFEGNAGVQEYVGGYEDYIRQRRSAPAAGLSVVGEQKETVAPEKRPAGKKETAAAKPKKKLSYNEKRELEALPGLIETLEAEISTLENQVSQPDFYQQDKEQIAGTLEHLEQQRKSLEDSFQRWEYLDQFDH